MSRERKKFDWHKWQVALTKHEMEKLNKKKGAKLKLTLPDGELKLSDDELNGIHWVASLPDFVAGGAGEKRDGIVVKGNRPDLFSSVFDDADFNVAGFWKAYVREPELVLALMLKLRVKRGQKLKKFKEMKTPSAIQAMAWVMHEMPNATEKVQLREAARMLGMGKKLNVKNLESIRKGARERLLNMK